MSLWRYGVVYDWNMQLIKDSRLIASGTVTATDSHSVAGTGYSANLGTGTTAKAVYVYNIDTGGITAVTDAAGVTWPADMEFSLTSQT